MKLAAHRSKTHRISLGWVVVLLSMSVTPLHATTHYESITFIANDGASYTNYATTRSDAPTYTLHLDKDESLEDYLYINPSEFQFDNTQAEHNRILFNQGDYAVISQGSLTTGEQPQLSIDEDGIYTLSTWDGTTLENGHFGYWNMPDNFAQFAAVWVLPDHFNIIDYLSNKPGEWVQRGNALAFITQDKNDLTFQIRYSARTQAIYHALKEGLGETEAVNISHSPQSVTLTLGNQIVFDSGSTRISSQGLAVIAEVARKLSTESSGGAADYQVVVAGHTDNVPIVGALAERYPSNWELSAARSMSVVHALLAQGLPPASLQARAFGEHQPLAANSSAEGRQQNRRTEIEIVPIDASEGSDAQPETEESQESSD